MGFGNEITFGFEYRHRLSTIHRESCYGGPVHRKGSSESQKRTS